MAIGEVPQSAATAVNLFDNTWSLAVNEAKAKVNPAGTNDNLSCWHKITAPFRFVFHFLPALYTVKKITKEISVLTKEVIA